MRRKLRERSSLRAPGSLAKFDLTAPLPLATPGSLVCARRVPGICRAPPDDHNEQPRNASPARACASKQTRAGVSITLCSRPCSPGWSGGFSSTNAPGVNYQHPRRQGRGGCAVISLNFIIEDSHGQIFYWLASRRPGNCVGYRLHFFPPLSVGDIGCVIR